MDDKNKLLWDQLVDLSIVCGMNQRYHQQMFDRSDFWGWLINAIVVAATTLTLAVGVASYFSAKGKFALWAWKSNGQWTFYGPPLDWFGMVTSAIAAAFGLILLLGPNDALYYKATFQAWSDLRSEVDDAISDCNELKGTGQPADEELRFLQKRLKGFIAKKNSINSRERSPDNDLLLQCLEREEESRGVAATDKTRGTAPANSSAMILTPAGT